MDSNCPQPSNLPHADHLPPLPKPPQASSIGDVETGVSNKAVANGEIPKFYKWLFGILVVALLLGSIYYFYKNRNEPPGFSTQSTASNVKQVGTYEKQVPLKACGGISIKDCSKVSIIDAQSLYMTPLDCHGKDKVVREDGRPVGINVCECSCRK